MKVDPLDMAHRVPTHLAWIVFTSALLIGIAAAVRGRGGGGFARWIAAAWVIWLAAWAVVAVRTLRHPLAFTDESAGIAFYTVAIGALGVSTTGTTALRVRKGGLSRPPGGLAKSICVLWGIVGIVNAVRMDGRYRAGFTDGDPLRGAVSGSPHGPDADREGSTK